MSDKENSQLPRRGMLLSLGSIGLGAVMGGIGTRSFYNDQEQVTATFNAGFINNQENEANANGNTNVGSAGSIDLLVDWITVHNGDVVAQSEENENLETESNTLRVQSEDMLPGDQGCIYIALMVEGSPAVITFQCESGNYTENGRNSAEEKAEDPIDAVGELQEVVQTTVGRLPEEPVNPAANLPPQFTDEYYNGVVENLEVISDDVAWAVNEGEIVWIGYYWSFPEEAGNQYQTDAYDISFTFNAETP